MKYLINLSYDGSKFYGFQKQKRWVTVQGEIEKALSQQKLGETDRDQIKVLTSIKTTASQNFLAEQHQKFSRFVQALFQPHTS